MSGLYCTCHSPTRSREMHRIIGWQVLVYVEVAAVGTACFNDRFANATVYGLVCLASVFCCLTRTWEQGYPLDRSPPFTLAAALKLKPGKSRVETESESFYKRRQLCISVASARHLPKRLTRTCGFLEQQTCLVSMHTGQATKGSVLVLLMSLTFFCCCYGCCSACY